MPNFYHITTRDQFKEYILTKMGYGVINVEMSETQIDLAIDDSLLEMWDLNTSQGSYLHYFVFTASAGVSEYCMSGMGIQDAYDVDLSFNNNGINVLFSPMNMMFYQDWVVNGNYPGGSGNRIGMGSFAVGGNYGLQMTEYNVGMSYLKQVQNQLSTMFTVKWHSGREILEILPPPRTTSVGMLALYVRQDERDLYNNRNFRELCVANAGINYGTNITKFSGQLPDGSTINGEAVLNRHMENKKLIIERIKGESEPCDIVIA